MPQPRDLSEREADALASMMGADSRRIDDLVGDVGEIKGDMRILKADTGRAVSGIEQLQLSMAAVGRHTVLMESQNAKIDALSAKHEKLDTRLLTVERDMPGIKETREDVRKALWIVIAAVIVAGLGLILVSKR